MKKWKLKISIPEFVLYCIAGGLAIWGITYVILGLLAEYLPIPNNENALREANIAFTNTFGLGYFGWGMIILSIGFAFGFIVLLVYAKRVDRSVEKENRRAARVNRRHFTKEKEASETSSEEVIEAEVK